MRDGIFRQNRGVVEISIEFDGGIVQAIPTDWIKNLREAEIIRQTAKDFFLLRG